MTNVVKFEPLAQKINPNLCARIASGFFYLLAACLTFAVAQAFINGTLPPELGTKKAFALFATSVSGLFIHFTFWIVLSSKFSWSSFAYATAAWSAPLLIVGFWRIG